MKTGGILSRLTGDVDTTTGLMQMAIISPTISVIRLIVVIVVLFVMNWRLALTVVAIIPGRDADELRLGPPRAADLPHDPPGRRGHGRPRRGNVLRHPRRARVRPGDPRAARTTCAGATASCARNCSRTAGSWCCGPPGACSSPASASSSSGTAGISACTGARPSARSWRSSVYMFLLLNPVWSIVNSFSELQRSLAAMERVFDILAMPADKPDRPDARPSARGRRGHRVRGRRVRVPRRIGRWCATSTCACPAAPWSRSSAAAARARPR